MLPGFVLLQFLLLSDHQLHSLLTFPPGLTRVMTTLNLCTWSIRNRKKEGFISQSWKFLENGSKLPSLHQPILVTHHPCGWVGSFIAKRGLVLTWPLENLYEREKKPSLYTLYRPFPFSSKSFHMDLRKSYVSSFEMKLTAEFSSQLLFLYHLQLFLTLFDIYILVLMFKFSSYFFSNLHLYVRCIACMRL